MDPTISIKQESTENIKERLNIHVKRRLQEGSTIAPTTNEVPEHPTEKPKQKRTYQKRQHDNKKVKTSPPDCGIPQRKNKRPKSGKVLEKQETEASIGGDDVDDSQDGENSKREKCPDVLGMVLALKKQQLMRDPEVQQILSKIMDIVKR